MGQKILSSSFNFNLLSILCLVLIYDVKKVHAYCKFDNDLQHKHQDLIDGYMMSPTTSMLTPFNYPEAATDNGQNTSDYDYGISYNYIDRTPGVDLKGRNFHYAQLKHHSNALFPL